MKTALQRLTAAIDDAMSQVKGASCVRCRSPACCRDAIYVHADEVDAIVAHIVASPHRRSLLFRIRQYVVEASDATRKMAAWAPHVKTGDDYLNDLKLWQPGAAPCPLLNERGMCSVYPVRPFVCRTHVSFDPPRNCERLMQGGGPVRSISILSFLPLFLSDPGFKDIVLNLNKFLPFALYEALVAKKGDSDD